jgi:glycosyltransferase involved in cell wall biosynthesis
MNITIVGHKLARGDGQGRINYEIARHALAKGHQLTLLATKVDDDLVAAGAKWIPIVSPIRKPELINTMYFARTADKHLRRLAPDMDLLVGNGFTLRHPHHVNLCQFVHGAWIQSPVHVAKLTRGPYAWYQWTYSKANSRWEKQAYAASKFVVPPSEKIRQELLSIGVPDEKIRVIYNGVDLAEFRPGSEDRKSLGLPEARPLALFVGDIRTPRKNLDTTLKALTQAPGVHLAVAGALARSPFPQLAKDLGIADRVTFLDFRRDIGKLMRAVDLFIFPSRYEAGTLVLLEALASGLPVVTARTAGGCEVMGEGAGRIIEDPNDVDALAGAILEMARDDAARRAASSAARTVAEKYSWTSMAEQYLDLFTQAAKLPL